MAHAIAMRADQGSCDPDTALVDRALHSREAFGEIYQRYMPRVFSYLVTRTPSAEDAADLTQARQEVATLRSEMAALKSRQETAETTIRTSTDVYFRERMPWRIGTVQLDAGPSIVAHLHGDLRARRIEAKVALQVLVLHARQRRRQAARPRLAGHHPRSRAQAAGARARRAHDRPVAAALVGRSRVEARLRQHRAAERRRPRPPSRRTRTPPRHRPRQPRRSQRFVVNFPSPLAGEGCGALARRSRA